MKKVVIPLLLIMIFMTSSPMTSAEMQDNGVVVVVNVDSTNLRFSPETITISEGDTVHFLWDGEILAHNAVERNGLFDSGDPSRNVDYSYTFVVGDNGTYEYVCDPHEELGMVGVIVVEPIPADVEENETIVNENQVQSTNSFSPWVFVVVILVGIIIVGRKRFQSKIQVEEQVTNDEENSTTSEVESTTHDPILAELVE